MVGTKVIQIAKGNREREKKEISHNIFLHLFALSSHFVTVYMRCTCIVHNIFFSLCVERF